MKTITIVGQGYVGLPLAKAFVNAGFKVFGLDSSQHKVDLLLKGESTTSDISREDILQMQKDGYVPTTDSRCIEHSFAVIICVPTPLTKNGGPDLTYVRQAAENVANHIANKTLVVLESTTYPGTTEEVLNPILTGKGLEYGTNYLLAFSPERIDPGNKKFGIKNTPKIIGGMDSEASSVAEDLYSNICDSVVLVSSPREAEMAKLLENTYRHVNIALVNELSIVCHDLGIDIREVISAAATKPFGFQAFYPGPGVGGHCIPIDPNYLNFKVNQELGRNLEFISLATKVNNAMPSYIVERIMRLFHPRKQIKEYKVLLCGVTYKKNLEDVRESPALIIAGKLIDEGLQVDFFDPYVSKINVGRVVLESQEDLESSASEADLTVILQDHDNIDYHFLQKISSRIFDTKGVYTRGLSNIEYL